MGQNDCQHPGDREYWDSHSGLVIGSACVQRYDVEIRDDEIQGPWHTRNSVSVDRGSGTRRRIRARNETLARAGRSPPAPRRRYSNVYFCISAEP
jgi:hypothetical protein